MKYKTNDVVNIKHYGIIDRGVITCIDPDGIIYVKSFRGLLYELGANSIWN